MAYAGYREKISIVVVGWHFSQPELYRIVSEERFRQHEFDVDLFISSHRQMEEIDPNLLARIQKLGWHILFFDNQGWDWGAYQQFVLWQKHNKGTSDYYLFLHDDIIIKKKGFLLAFHQLLIEMNVVVVGNSNPNLYGDVMVKRSSFSNEFIGWCSDNNIAIASEAVKIIRGSCFFTTRAVAESVLSCMPIKAGGHAGFGNWSCRLFSCMVADMYGDVGATYLSSRYLRSKYIEELFRNKKYIRHFHLFQKCLALIARETPILWR